MTTLEKQCVDVSLALRWVKPNSDACLVTDSQTQALVLAVRLSNPENLAVFASAVRKALAEVQTA